MRESQRRLRPGLAADQQTRAARPSGRRGTRGPAWRLSVSAKGAFLDELLARGPGRDFRAPLHVQLAEDVLDVRLDCLDRDNQALRNFVVRCTTSDQQCDFLLAPT